MLTRTKTIGAASGLVATVVIIAVGTAATASNAPNSAKLFIPGKLSWKINAYQQDSLRWSPGTVTIRSGGTLTIINRNAHEQEPHTFSIVNKSQLPHTPQQLAACENGGGVCLKIALSHGVNPNAGPPTGPPPTPVVDVGKVGIDQPGDSDARLHPRFNSVTEKITAKPGTTLYFICAVHPWMQGKLIVK